MNPPRLPDAIEIEKTLIGVAIVMGDVMPRVDLEPEAFRLERHVTIWRVLRGLDQQRRAIDYATVSDALAAAGQLEAAGGAAYLAELTAYPVIGPDPGEYAKIIRDRASRRAVIAMAGELAKAAFDLDGDFDKARSAALDGLARVESGNRRVAHIGEALGKLLDETQERSQDPKELYGLDTGFKDLNANTSGLQPGELFLLAGDPGVGKTLFAVQLAAQMAQAGAPGVIYELEMGDVQLCRRIIAAKTGISPKKMRAGTLDANDFTAFVQAIAETERLSLWLSDDTSWTTAAIRANLTKMRAQYGVRWFLVDYLALLTDTYGQNEIERSNAISKGLRRICKDLGLAGLVVHSLNKSGLASDSKNLSHLAGAVGVSFDADVVCFMNRHQLTDDEKKLGEKPKDSVRTLTFAKMREDAPNKFINLVMRPGLPAFADYAKEPNAQRVGR